MLEVRPVPSEGARQPKNMQVRRAPSPSLGTLGRGWGLLEATPRRPWVMLHRCQVYWEQGLGLGKGMEGRLEGVTREGMLTVQEQHGEWPLISWVGVALSHGLDHGGDLYGRGTQGMWLDMASSTWIWPMLLSYIQQ